MNDIHELLFSFLTFPSPTSLSNLTDLLIRFGTQDIFKTLPKENIDVLERAAEKRFGSNQDFYHWLWTYDLTDGSKPIDLVSQGKYQECLKAMDARGEQSSNF
jgi:hypothetical protein